MTGLRSRNEVESLEGHYAGPVTRLLAAAADGFIAFSLYNFILGLIVVIWNALAESDFQAPDRAPIVWAVGFALWLMVYNGVCWSVWWKTPGKALLGLRVVCRDGADLDARHAFVRALVYPVLVWFGSIGVLLGRERRALHDVVARTTVVYDWNARTARWRLLARRGAPTTEEAG